MSKSHALTLAALVAALSIPSLAGAQYSSTSSGSFGSRTIGTTMGGASSSAFGNSGMGTGTGIGTGSGSRSGYGSRSGSTNSARVTAIGQNPSTNPLYSSRQEGSFVGADTQNNRTGMLGRSSTTTGSTYQNRSGSYSNSRSSTNRSGSTYRNGTSSNSRGSSSSTGGQMLLGYHTGGELRPAVSSQLGSVMAARLAKSMRLPAGTPLTVTMEGQTALLQGVVATPHDRDLAEQLVRLEPGVAEVANELRIDPSTGATLGPPQSSGTSSPANATPAVLPSMAP
jgi:osmotically-inducible protein OsmY